MAFVVRKHRRRLGSAVAAVLAIGGLSANAHGAIKQYFYAWSNANADLPGINFASEPNLNDTNYATAAAQLAYSQAHGYPLAVVISGPIAPNGNAITQVLDKFPVQYVFLDFEESSSKLVTDVSTVLNELKGTASSNAFVGNYFTYPNAPSDLTRTSFNPPPNPLPNSDYVKSGLAALGGPNATSGLRQMANTELYPGAPDFRSPGASNNNHNVDAGGSTAPNIRSALFTLPIERLTLVTNSFYGRGTSLSQYNTGNFDPSFSPNGKTPTGLNIPWVTRFNNYGNAALTNMPGTAQNPYQFNGTVDSIPSDGQLPSRGDFSAQVLQYRMRGANSINLFLATVTDQFGNPYTETEQEQDMNAGWFATTTAGAPVTGASVMNGIFAGRYGFANLTDLVRLDLPSTVKGKTVYTPGAATHAENTGVIWSGVYSENASNKPTPNTSYLSILLSNMDAKSHVVDLGTVAGYSIYDPLSLASDKSGFDVSAGQHLLLTFNLRSVGGSPVWDLATDSIVFTDNNRDGIGAPEPASLGILGIGAFGLLLRRRRHARA